MIEHFWAGLSVGVIAFLNVITSAKSLKVNVIERLIIGGTKVIRDVFNNYSVKLVRFTSKIPDEISTLNERCSTFYKKLGARKIYIYICIGERVRLDFIARVEKSSVHP